MNIWKDRQWRINILFATPFLLAALVFVGLNVYKHVRYTTLDMTIQGRYTVLWGNHLLAAKYDSSADTTHVNLRTNWWGSTTYMLTHNGKLGWSFVVYPTIRGRVRITNPPHPAGLEFMSFNIETLEGKPTTYLRTNQWYEEGTVVFEYNWVK